MSVTLEQLDLVCADVEASIAFYRLLGVDMPDNVWRTESGTHFLHIEQGSMTFDMGSVGLARAYNAGYRAGARGGSVVIGFSAENRAAVDAIFARMTGAGYKGLQTPFDAFWGSRYAIVEDPDGNHVGIMSPVDPDKRSKGPNL
ncbi:MAG: glyoxalase [Alphaproteobacteria bacterium]|nr:glyoxalase [Alphaproteobacteria bacterium]